uniref:25 kDa salivary gland protein B n=1 Tax=Ixodes scapularis TaxID=6945 RepID=Q95WZ0_IXOSC|nr:25 kDa salivary gland protein B [Ixodes scapularis]
MKLVLSLAVLVCGVLVRTYGKTHQVGSYGKPSSTTPRGILYGSTTTVPPEEDPAKLREQNATRVVQMNATQWVKWRTFNVTDPFRGNYPLQCENFKVMEKRTPFNYSLQYKYRSGYSWVTLTETLVLGILGEQRLPPNDMFFQRTPIGIPTNNYVLYSNYVNCTILRIPMPGQGRNHCDLWMANMTVSQEPPKICSDKFYEYCNTTQKFTVYFPNCTEISGF